MRDLKLNLRVATLVALFPSLCSSQMHAGNDFSREEIRHVLVLAREAALDWQHDEHGSGGWLPEDLRTIIQGFKSIDDWQDASVLQKRINLLNKTDVLFAPPHATLADYRSLEDSLKPLNEYEREQGFLQLIRESASDSFFSYGERLAETIKDAQTQSNAYAAIAAARWKKGNQELAGKFFQAAVDAAHKMKPLGLGDPTQSIAQQLNRIAEQRFRAGDLSGADEIFRESTKMALEADGPSGYLLKDLILNDVAETQYRVGLPANARETAEKIGDEQLREGLLDRIHGDERRNAILNSPLADARKAVTSLSGPYEQAAMLTALANKQLDHGDKKGALNTLNEAFATAQQIDPDGPIIGGAAYRYRLIAIGYLNAGAKDKATAVLDQLTILKEAVEGSNDDFLFDLVVGYAAIGDFSRAHSLVAEWGDDPDEQACAIVGSEEVHQGRAEDAISWALTIKSAAGRTSALVGISEGMRDINQRVNQISHP